MALTDKLTAIANAVRYKAGKTEKMTFEQMTEEIYGISGGSGNSDIGKLVDGSITTLDIPNGATKIRDYAFYNCKSLTSVTIPNSVTSISSSAFYDCTGLTSVTIPNSVRGIGGNAFYNCTSLTSITIPNSVTSISGNAFSYCTGLTSVTIQNGVKNINDGAFRDCTSLTSVTIPNSVTSISSNAFYSCTSLTSVTLESGFNANNLNVSSSTLLTADVIVAMFEALADRTSETKQYTLTIGSTNLSKLTQEQIKIATDKNWVVN